MTGNFYYIGRGDALTGLIPNPLRYGSTNPQDYNDYMNGYNSVSKMEFPSRGELLKRLEDFNKHEKN